jgi:AdoMet-dependent heme synthase
VCPILIEAERARMADTLEGSMRPYTLSHAACFTCHAEGLSCRT